MHIDTSSYDSMRRLLVPPVEPLGSGRNPPHWREAYDSLYGTRKYLAAQRERARDREDAEPMFSGDGLGELIDVRNLV